MRLNQNTEIIIGPPGTGKTATLIKKVTYLINEGEAPDQIGYISFTRQAVREASARIIAATGRSAEEFSGFRTLHAMAFWLMGKAHKDLTDFYDLEQIAYLPKHLADNVSRERTKMYAHLYNYSRVTGCTLTRAWEKYAGQNSGTEEDFCEWVALYREHKKSLSKIDFTDLIQEFVDRKVVFPFKYLFIDEAQDFSPDQWGAVALLAKYSQKVTLAGDSDQAVFGWSGAQSSLFDDIEGERHVLSQSYRVPRLPHILAGRVLKCMQRTPTYRPTADHGRVVFFTGDELSELPLDNGEVWFFLCRNNYHVERIQRLLFRRQVFFGGVSERVEDYLQKLIRRIRWYNDAVETGELSTMRKRLLSKEASNLDQSIQNREPWHIAFDTWPLERTNYLLATQGQWDRPTVFVGTFHASKGAEAENVVLYGDCTRRIATAIENDDQEELRAIYVAMTRTSKNLYLIQQTGKWGIPWNKFQRLPEDLENGLL